MSNKRLDSFSDCFQHRVRIQIRCWQCGRTRIVQHHGDSLFGERGMRTNMHVLAIVDRVKCGNCGAKEPVVTLLLPHPTGK